MKSTFFEPRIAFLPYGKAFRLRSTSRALQILPSNKPRQAKPQLKNQHGYIHRRGAPDFTLQTKNAEGLKEVVLSSFKGQSSVVLLFFPFAFTGVCTEETCSVRDDLSSYEELDAQVLGISVDSPFAQEAMALKEGLNFPL